MLPSSKTHVFKDKVLVNEDYKTEIEFPLSPKGIKINITVKFEDCTVLLDFEKELPDVRINFSILKKSEISTFKKVHQYEASYSKTKSIIHPFNLTKAEFNDPSNNFITDSCTIIELQITVEFKAIISSVLKKKITNAIERGHFSDFKIIVGEQEIDTHKLVLAVQSKFFRNYFEEEKNKNVKTFKILNYNIAEVQEAVEFMYTGWTGFQSKSLFILAKEFGIDDLSTKCQKVLSKRLSIQNACKCYNFAVSQKADILTQACLEFIKENKEKIAAGNHFKDLEPERCAEVLTYIAKTDSTEHEEVKSETIPSEPTEAEN